MGEYIPVTLIIYTHEYITPNRAGDDDDVDEDGNCRNEINDKDTSGEQQRRLQIREVGRLPASAGALSLSS